MTIRVGVFGAGGRMGATVCRAVADDPDLELVAAVDPHHAGSTCARSPGRRHRAADVARRRALLAAGADVAVDFTQVDAARENLDWCAANGVHAVVGTTGFGDEDFERLAGRSPTATASSPPTSPSARC